MIEQCEDFIIDSDWQEVTETFDDMNLKQELLRGIYSYGFEHPLVLQKRAIKPIILCRDTIVRAESGLGKTMTCIIGILERIDTSINQCQAIVLVPDVVFAIDISTVILQIGHYLGVKTHGCAGGNFVEKDIRMIEKGCHVVVGTPERVFDMVSRNYLNMSHLKILVFELADEILIRGFKNKIQDIFQYLPASIQFCLFSANNDQAILNLVIDFLRDPVKILVTKKR